MKQELHGLKQYQDLIRFLSTDHATYPATNITVKGRQEIENFPRFILQQIIRALTILEASYEEEDDGST